MEEDALMAYPDWAGPFGVPTDSEEFLQAAAVSGFLLGMGYGVREASISYVLNRMAWHRISPILYNRKALLALARREMVFPSVSNVSSIFGRMAVASPALLPGVATASALGWAATGDLHGAVPPGTASGIGMPMAPTTGGSVDEPLGLTWGSLSTWAENMIPGFLK